jgi:hypothetical protein
MVDLFTFLFNFLDIILDFYLFPTTLDGVRVQKLAVESPDLLGILEKFSISLCKLFLFDFLLEFSLFLIDPPAFELFLLELFEPFFFLSLFEVLEVVGPLIGSLLAFLEEICCSVLFAVGWVMR